MGGPEGDPVYGGIPPLKTIRCVPEDKREHSWQTPQMVQNERRTNNLNPKDAGDVHPSSLQVVGIDNIVLNAH